MVAGGAGAGGLLAWVVGYAGGGFTGLEGYYAGAFGGFTWLVGYAGGGFGLGAYCTGATGGFT